MDEELLFDADLLAEAELEENVESDEQKLASVALMYVHPYVLLAL